MNWQIKDGNIFGYDEDGALTVITPHGSMKITNDNLYLTDKYGNTITIDDMKAVYQQNSPTYDELYEHWLKTNQND